MRWKASGSGMSEGHRLPLRAYALLVGAVGLNAWLVTSLSGIPSLAAFAATLGGTLSGALGFQVLARLQAWAKRMSSAGKPVSRADQPFADTLLGTWARSQTGHCDLTRDGRNIRKDAWLQLHGRFSTALTLLDNRAIDAIADALIDHRLTFGEVEIDPILGREFGRLLGARFGASKRAILAAMDTLAKTHGLNPEANAALVEAILGGDHGQGNFRV